MINLSENDFPTLYTAMDGAAKRAQSKYLGAIKINSALLISGAGVSVAGVQSVPAAFVAAGLFLAAIFVSIFIATKKYEEVWYRARAVAESVKTSSWRFMMKADPYWDAPSLPEVRAQFRKLLLNILNEHKDLAKEFASDASEGDAVTDAMNAVRALETLQRLDCYKQLRIEDQRSWYERKAKYNRIHGTAWFSCFVLLQTAAIALVIARVGYPSFGHWPVEIFVVAAACTFTWINVKRFRELAAAYALTAHEIVLLRGEAELVETDEQLAEFIRDSENAFSREHTQWAARKE